MSLVETPNYLDVVTQVAATPYTVGDLRTGVSLKGTGLLDDSLAQQSAPYITLPKRKLTLDAQGQLVFSGGNTDTPKLIDESLSYDADTLDNTLDRELVIVLKGRDDSFTTMSSDIKTLRHTIMRLAVDEKMRAFIREQLLEAKSLLQEIDDAQKSNLCPPGLETRAKRFYNTSVKAFGLIAPDEASLASFSWHKKSRKLAQYPYMCKSWIMITTIYGLIKA